MSEYGYLLLFFIKSVSLNMQEIHLWLQLIDGSHVRTFAPRNIKIPIAIWSKFGFSFGIVKTPIPF